MLAICYAEHLSINEKYDLDGIFFDHEYDPIALSAPSFGIFPHRIKDFSSKVVKELPNIDNVRTVGHEGFLKPKETNKIKLR